MFDLNILSADTPRQARLRDGSLFRIRALAVEDRHLLVELFERLSAHSRRMRFLAAKRSLTEEDLDFLTSADEYDHIALAAVRLNALGEEAEPLGLARCIRFTQKPESAEMSIAVADDVQRSGVGSALLDQLKRVARSVGIRHFVCEALAENPGMRALATRMGGDVHWHGDGTVEYEWPVPDNRPIDAMFYSADPIKELNESVELWWTLMLQSASVAINYYDGLFQRSRDLGLLRTSP
ncbi:MAG: GNAT family N-acetyltransferase [Chromatiaceae bacterium]|jgi:GNAT superfamily N-acetyltransferase|nr:GNAT family N-acetyltransferase [Chromatiaceae bacterium]